MLRIADMLIQLQPKGDNSTEHSTKATLKIMKKRITLAELTVYKEELGSTSKRQLVTTPSNEISIVTELGDEDTHL